MGQYVSSIFYETPQTYPMEMAELETQKGMKNIFYYFGNVYEGSDISCESGEEDQCEYNLIDE